MKGLTTDLVSQACRIFLNLAYPDGENTIPAPKVLFADLPTGLELAQYHAQTPFPSSSFQEFHNSDGNVTAYALRLGSKHFPHLKLRIQWLEDVDHHLWVFTVDTHDAFSDDTRRPPDNHPDAQKWTDLQKRNAALKEEIERAWEGIGLTTFNAVLRQDLRKPPPTG